RSTLVHELKYLPPIRAGAVFLMDQKFEAILPKVSTRRWVARCKMAIVDGVRRGELTLSEACARYQLSEEEFLSWERALNACGPPGLRTTHTRSIDGTPSGNRSAHLPSAPR